MKESEAKQLKQRYANWESYKILLSETTVRAQYIRKTNNGWKLRQEF